MPREYKKVTSGRKYTSKVSKQTLEQAKKAIEKDSLSVRKAALQFGVSKSTLQDFIKNIHPKKAGGQTVLNESEEKILVDRLIVMGNWGFPLDMLDLRMLVKAYLDRRGVVVRRFKNNLPGEEWARSFMKRHKESLTSRISQNIKHHRAKVSPQIIKEYFQHLTQTLDGVPPENILNYDETNLTDDPGRKKVIVRRGTKYPERVINSTKSSVSVMFCGTASGTMLPPYVVYKAIHLYDTWTQGGPEGTRYNRSQSGWFEAVSFEDWFDKIALPYLKNLEGKKVLIGDNLSSHVSPSVIENCEKNNISFVLLPPNSTNLTQPLDVAVFRPLKRIWRDILLSFKQTPAGRRYASLPKDHFPTLLKKMMNKLNVTVTDNLKSGFKKCGIVPLDGSKVLSQLPDEECTVDIIEDESFSMDQSLIGILKTMRYGDETTNSTAGSSGAKKKRLCVPAGKSISDLQSTTGTGTDNNNNSTGSENEDDPMHLQTETQEETESVASEATVELPRVEHLSLASWVLTKIYNKTKKCYRYFIAVIVKLEPDIEVRFLKHITGTKNVFVNPEHDEFNEIEADDIIRILPEPTLDRKLRMIFDVDTSIWPK